MRLKVSEIYDIIEFVANHAVGWSVNKLFYYIILILNFECNFYFKTYSAKYFSSSNTGLRVKLQSTIKNIMI